MLLKKDRINLFEAFSGIWSQHQALKNLWYKINLIWISDWYVNAIIAYAVNHLKIKPREIDKTKVTNFLKNYSLSFDSKKSAKNLHSLSDDKLSIIYQIIKNFWNLDINYISWKDLVKKEIDLFTYSFPCQDISQQWKQKWFSKDTESRSWLLWQIERILKEIYEINPKKLPKVLMMENVKALLNDSFKNDLHNWLDELEKLWYKSNFPFVVNSANLWETQRRERVFMFSYLWDKTPPLFKINQTFKDKFIWDIFEEEMFHEEFSTNKNIKIVEMIQKTWIKKYFLEWYSNFNAESFVYFKDWKSPTITASWAQSRIKIFHHDKIIYLNWYEHLKLQWFTDKKFYKNLVKYWLSDAKIKFLAWNSINIRVLEELFKFYL